jgi:predicted alpha/beta-hydrolase family hydrolase
MDIISKKQQITINGYNISLAVLRPELYKKCLIIANGAGGNMESEFISRFHQRLCLENIITVKFNFHYQELGKKVPDRNNKCRETYLGVVNYLIHNEKIAAENIILGGKSMGGRIATQIAGQTGCEKIIVFGYPLHPPGKPDKLRDAHLYDLDKKVLIFQGEKDAFGNRDELDPVIKKMKNTRVVYIPQGNHSLKAPKKSGFSNEQIEEMIVEGIKDFI